MSDDIIERLRSAQCYQYEGSRVVVGWLRDNPIDEAVEKIARLSVRVTELENLRSAVLAETTDAKTLDRDDAIFALRTLRRAALKEPVP